MNRLLPYPLVSLFLLAAWLLLNQSVSPGHLALGALLALLWPLALVRLEFPHTRLRRPLAAAALAWLVLVDIVRSNLAVTRLILRPGHRKRVAEFIHIPLALRSSHGLAVLACIITATPGTLWVAFDAERGRLTIHVLDLIDEEIWVRTIRDRYERLLLEVFE